MRTLHVNSGFSESSLQKIESHNVGMAITQDKDFYKYYLNIIRTFSINDAKQLIYIYRLYEGLFPNFDFLTEEDVLIELNTIVQNMPTPSKNLGKLLSFRSDSLLPTGTHQWIYKNSIAMLVYAHMLPSELLTKVFYGLDELKDAFENMINFSIPEEDIISGQVVFRKIDFGKPINKDKIIYEFNKLKGHYLQNEIPKNKLKKIYEATDDQLDAILESLDKKGLRILKERFFAIDRVDKLNLVIASLNSIPKDGIFEERELSEDKYGELQVSPNQNIMIASQDGVIILADDRYGFDRNKYKYIVVEGYNVPNTRTFYGGHTPILASSLPEGKYQLRYVGKKEKVKIIENPEEVLEQIKRLLKSRNIRLKKKIARNSEG